MWFQMNAIESSKGITQSLVAPNANIFNEVNDGRTQAWVKDVVHPAVAQGITLGGGHV
jgi:hypothetical protein